MGILRQGKWEKVAPEIPLSTGPRLLLLTICHWAIHESSVTADYCSSPVIIADFETQ